MATRIVVDDDEQQIADLIKQMRRLRGRLSTGQVSGTHDELTASATPETEFQLTYIPVAGTCAMFNNGLEQTEDTDYTVDYDTGLVTFDTALTTGDQIDFRYLVTDWLVARSLPEDTGAISISDTFDRAASSTTINPASDGGTWTVDAGTMGIDSATPAEAYLVDTTGGATVDGQYIFRRDFGSSAVDMSIDNYRVVGTTPNSYLWIAYDPATQSGYRLQFQGTATADVERYASGSSTILGAGLTLTSWFNNHWSTLRFVHDGAGVLTVYQDGSLIASRTDGATPLTGTWVGASSPGTGRDFWQNFTASG